MDGRTLRGKTVTFVIICVFVAAFILLFGTDYAILGITVATAAMLMLEKDLSVRPLSNLGSLIVFMVMMGVGSFVASLDPYLGMAVNFAVVFVTVFVSMQDLRSPMHFPLLLFYASMVTLPITIDQMPDRLLILAVSALFIVGLNVLVNRHSRDRSSHQGVAAICRGISERAGAVLRGEEPDVEGLESMCVEVNRGMYDRLKSNFFTGPRDRTVLDLVVSLMDVGRAVCLRERDADVLRDLVDLMGFVAEHEEGVHPASDVELAVGRFVRDHSNADVAIVSSLRDVAEELISLESGPRRLLPDGLRGIRAIITWLRDDTGRALILMVREEARTDSARFTFAVRMALIFALVAFAWDYWRWDNAQVLLFTVIALIVPYLEDSRAKSAMRFTGTLLGTAIFSAVLALSGGNTVVLLTTALLSGYLYVVMDTDRYDRKIFFYTIVVMVASAFTSDSETLTTDRIAFTVAGMLVAMVANRVILPYRISDESRELATRSLAVCRERMSNISRTVRGKDGSDDAVLSILSACISQKMMLNADRRRDPLTERFRIAQDSLAVQCSSLFKAVHDLEGDGRLAVDRLMTSALDPKAELTEPDTSTMMPGDAEVVMRAYRVARKYRADSVLLYDIIVQGYLEEHGGPTGSAQG